MHVLYWCIPLNKRKSWMKKRSERLNSEKRLIRSVSNVFLSNFLINYLFGTSPEDELRPNLNASPWIATLMKYMMRLSVEREMDSENVDLCEVYRTLWCAHLFIKVSVRSKGATDIWMDRQSRWQIYWQNLKHKLTEKTDSFPSFTSILTATAFTLWNIMNLTWHKPPL